MIYFWDNNPKCNQSDKSIFKEWYSFYWENVYCLSCKLKIRRHCKCYDDAIEKKRLSYIKEFEDKLKRRNEFIDKIVILAARAGKPTIKSLMLHSLKNQQCNTNAVIKF